MSSPSGMELPPGWGGGPFEMLLADVATGARTFRAAMTAAGRLGDAAAQDGYVGALLANADRLPDRAALRFLALVQRGCAARPDGAMAAAVPRAVTFTYLWRVAAWLCVDLDPGVLVPALAVADDVEAWLAAAPDLPDDVRAEALGVLGRLCVQYVLSRPRGPGLRDALDRAARASAGTHATESWTEYADGVRPRIPSPELMLRRGERLLRAAADVAVAEARGEVLVELGGCLAWLAALGEPVDMAEAIALLRESVELSGEADGTRRRLARALLRDLGEVAAPEPSDAAPASELDDLVDRVGTRQAVEVLLGAVAHALAEAPEAAEGALQRATIGAELYGDDEQRQALWGMQPAVEALRLPGGLDGLPLDPPDEAWSRLEAQARAASWGRTRYATALALLAVQLADRGHVDDGAALVSTVRHIVPAWAHSRVDWLRYVELVVATKAHVAHTEQGDVDASLLDWIRATDLALDLRLEGHVAALAQGAPDLALRVSEAALEPLLRHLRATGRRIEDMLGDLGVAIILTGARRALARLVPPAEPGVDPRAGVQLALDLLKGERYAAALTDATRFGRPLDERARGLLDQVHRLEASLGTDHGLDRFDPRLLLAQDIAVPDEDPHDERRGLRALRRTFDQRLRVSLLGSSAPGRPIDEVDPFDALDDHTVALEHVLSSDITGRPLLVDVVATTESWTMQTFGLPFESVELSYDAGSVRASGTVLTPLVQDLRDKLQEPSDPDPVGDDAADVLSVLASMLLGGRVEQHLAAAIESGRTVLQVLPHGALHFVPFHLLPFRGRPLADWFTVMQVPNRALLTVPRPGPASRRRSSIAAFGLTYADRPHGLWPLTRTASEARSVAGLFGRQPEVDGRATESAVVAALQTARFVHIAAHGAHDYEAPSFHCVYLTADGPSDGLLRAYELANLDLRGLELVTLSACETALGHIDESDNPSGLPAALLLAGVGCVIGTLWFVRSDPSEHFFVALYRELAGGAAIVDAFGRAQAETRAAFPMYRDWGAFVLLGDGLHR